MSENKLSLDDFFQLVFGHPDNDNLSDTQKFNAIQKQAYEIGDGETLNQLRQIKERKEIQLSLQEEINFEDSVLFLK